MNKIISDYKSNEEDKTGGRGEGVDKKVREDFLDEVTFEQSHE